MISHGKMSQRLAIGLAILAGFVDALGFLRTGGYFVSFMSGNSTRLAVHAAQGLPLQTTLVPVAIIAVFVAGVILGKVIRRYRSQAAGQTVLGFMTLALSAAASFHAIRADQLAIPLMVLAMGAANNVFMRDGEVAIGVTYMTGTLVKLGQRVADRILGEQKGEWLPYLSLWAGLVAGAVLGAFGFGFIGLASLWIAVLWCALLTVLARGI